MNPNALPAASFCTAILKGDIPPKLEVEAATISRADNDAIPLFIAMSFYV